MKWRDRTLEQIADMICGNGPWEEIFFPYRSGGYITRFFRDADTDYAHDGSTRNWWVAKTLAKILEEPHPDAQTPPETFRRVIRTLMDPTDANNEGPEREGALKALNVALTREGFEALDAPSPRTVRGGIADSLSHRWRAARGSCPGANQAISTRHRFTGKNSQPP